MDLASISDISVIFFEYYFIFYIFLIQVSVDFQRQGDMVIPPPSPEQEERKMLVGSKRKEKILQILSISRQILCCNFCGNVFLASIGLPNLMRTCNMYK